jgi:hypothetical protein
MPSSPDLIGRPDVWRKVVGSKLDRLRIEAQETEAALSGVEERDAQRARRADRRKERLGDKYPSMRQS